MANFLAPRGIDLSHYNYVVMDGLYYSFLYIKAGGYPSRVRAGWMSSLINAGEGVDIDVHLRRENRSRTIDKVAQRIRLNRTKLKSMQDTSTDYEELTNSIQAGYFIKNGIANYNEDLFYMSVFITVSAKTYEELLWRKQQMVDMLKSMDMYTSECSFQQEAALQSVMPFLKISPKLEKKVQRNVLTSGAASSYKGGCFSTYAYRLIWNEICTALIYANRRAAKECELIPEVLGKEDSLDEHHELSMILDRLEANASEAMAKGIRAIRLSAEGYSHAEIGSILGESDKCVAARISRTRKYLRSHPDLAAF